MAIGSCEENKVEIWNIANQSYIKAISDHKGCVNALLSFQVLNKTYLISSSVKETITLYDTDIKSKKIVNHTGSILALDYNPYLQLIASSSTENTIKIWSFLI